MAPIYLSGWVGWGGVGGFTVIIMQVSVQIELNLTGLELSLAIKKRVSIINLTNIFIAHYDLHRVFLNDVSKVSGPCIGRKDHGSLK